MPPDNNIKEDIKKLFVIDAMAMAFRNFYAFGTRLKTTGGQPTSAIFGSAMFVHRLVEKQRPDYLVVAGDSREPTFRHEMYKEYKANRDSMPEELAAQLDHFYELFNVMGIPLLKIPGYEADDLIGTLAKKFGNEQLHTFIVSGDKDFMQLVNDHTFLYTPKKGEEATIVDAKGVQQKFGCTPDQVIDILALMGDSSDNVPGVRGIGEKGAAKLIEQFGSLDSIYNNLEKITNKRQHNGLMENREMAYLSKDLVTIKTDCPMELDLKAMVCEPKNISNEDLAAFYDDLEFKALATKIRSHMSESLSAPKTRQAAENRAANSNYRLVNTKNALEALLTDLRQESRFAVDTETTGLDIVNSTPIGISVALKPHEAYYIPLVEKHLDDLTAREVIENFKPILESPDYTKVGHNLKFDIQMFKRIGIQVSLPLFDTYIADHLLNAGAGRHGLDDCCLKHLNIEKIKTETLIGKKGEFSMLDAPLADLTEYACEDADCTLQLADRLAPLLQENELIQLFNQVECPLIPVLADMERSGVFVNLEVLHNLSQELEKMARKTEQLIYAEAGQEFNINSPKQLQKVLFTDLAIHEKLGIKRLKKTKTGFSTDESVLKRLSAHPLPALILEFRTAVKLKNTYVDALPTLINPRTGRIHTSYLQGGTATGRLSSNSPNLQNIPIRSPMGQQIRGAFQAASDDCVLISADYSQVELRLLAHISDEAGLKEAFAAGDDIHTATAAKIFGFEPQNVTKEQRAQAKAINFGIIYGMGANRLAQETGLSVKEASAFIDKYFATYSGIKRWITETIQNATEAGECRTILGRRRSTAELQGATGRSLAMAQNVAVNTPIQGSAADLIKAAMIKIHGDLHKKNLSAKMLIQVHDELVFECPKHEIAEVTHLIEDSMTKALELSVPLQIDLGVGNNWLEAH